METSVSGVHFLPEPTYSKVSGNAAVLVKSSFVARARQ